MSTSNNFLSKGKQVAATALTAVVAIPLAGIATPAFANDEAPEIAGESQTTEGSTPIEQAEQQVAQAVEAAEAADQAVQDAEAEQAAVAEAQEKAQTAVEEAEAKYSEAEQNFIDAINEDGVAAAEQDVITAEDVLDTAVQNEASISDQVDNAQTAVNDKTADLDAKTDALTDAQAAAQAAQAIADSYDLEALEATEADAKDNLADKETQAAAQATAAAEALQRLTDASALLDQAQADAEDSQNPQIVADAELLVQQLIVEHQIATANMDAKEAVFLQDLADYNAAQEALDAAENDENASAFELAQAQEAFDLAQDALATATANRLEAENTLALAGDALIAADALIQSTEADFLQSLDDLVEAETTRANAAAVLQDAQQRADELQIIADNYAQLYDLNAAGYFESMNATDAYRVLTDPIITRHLAAIDLDASTLR